MILFLIKLTERINFSKLFTFDAKPSIIIGIELHSQQPMNITRENKLCDMGHSSFYPRFSSFCFVSIIMPDANKTKWWKSLLCKGTINTNSLWLMSYNRCFFDFHHKRLQLKQLIFSVFWQLVNKLTLKIWNSIVNRSIYERDLRVRVQVRVVYSFRYVQQRSTD